MKQKTERKKGRFISYDDGLRKWLGNPPAAVEYIKACIEESGADMPEVVLAALREVADVHGMTWLSKQTGLGRQTLYQMLDPKVGNPSIRNFVSIIHKLGIRMTFEPEAMPQSKAAR